MVSPHSNKAIWPGSNAFFISFLDSGAIRVGLEGGAWFDFPEDHPEFQHAAKLTILDVQGAWNEYLSTYGGA